jgi:hypothetical protein
MTEKTHGQGPDMLSMYDQDASILSVFAVKENVQFADMNGDGSVDLLVTSGSLRGYYSKDSIKGEWRGFHHYNQAPSFDLKDPNVKLVDIDGDGVIDVMATLDHHFLFIRNTTNIWCPPHHSVQYHFKH